MADQNKFWQRRESRNNMKVIKNEKAAATNILEAIAQFSSGKAAAEGQKQMKIVVKKEDLKQVLQTIRDGRISLARRGPPSLPRAALSLEQRLSFMRRRQILRAAGQAKARTRSGSWSPVLQSIPEEL